MASGLLQLFIPIFGLGINIAAQLLSHKRIIGLGLLKSEYLGFTLGFLLITLSELYLDTSLSLLIANLIIYTSLGFCYFTFVNLGETSRRVRILRELAGCLDGLTAEGILQRYNAREVTQRRIGRLINNGQVRFRDGKYYIGNSTVLLMAKVIERIKLIVLGERQVDSD